MEQNQGSNLSFADPAASGEAPNSSINNEKPKATKRDRKKTDKSHDVEMKDVTTSDGKRCLRGKQMESYNETKLAAKCTQQICTQPKVLVQPKEKKKEEPKKVYIQEVDPLRPYELITLDIQGEEDI